MRLLPPGGEDGRDAREDPGNHHDRDWPRVGAVGHGGGRGWRSNAGRGNVGVVVVTPTQLAARVIFSPAAVHLSEQSTNGKSPSQCSRLRQPR